MRLTGLSMDATVANYLPLSLYQQGKLRKW